MRKSFKWIFAILVIASVFCGVGCKDKVEVELKPTNQYGTVKGKAFYSNENVDNHSGIQITLVSTDGLRSVAYCESRGIATNARSVSDIKTTSEDGSYSFENIPVGTYTIWASSRNSVEEAIETNVNVRANEVVTANDLNLVATGNIKGTITIDGKTDGTLGLDVFIAGTPYVAKVGPTGNYEISKIPASKGYMLCVQKGEYTTIINEDLEVKAKETIEVGCKNLLSEDWAIENEAQTNPTFKWLGELATEPENPELYDAYYNTTDGCSYIWNGSDWDLLAKSGEDGVDGEDGKDGTNGKDGVDGQSIVWKGELEAAPENPELYWAYYNIKDGCSYIWNGNDWDLLAKSGEDGEDGKDGTNGKDGEDGKDGVNGTDGKDGVDGLSIVWKGALEAAPENPELYWAYYNTTDGCSYIWNGSSWDLLAKSGKDGADGEDGKDGTNGKDGEDGKDGVNGTDGKDGVDGLSIVWKGELEAAPENPELYWAYYNTTDGCSYIWNGSDWDLLAKSGEDGVDGEDGKDGTNGKDGEDGRDGVDGQSIVWKGELEGAPENPELYWAYYNINTGCSYIWNGSSWDLLTQHANHTFNEWTVVMAPTCETEGKEERACTVCLYKEEKSIPATGHSYGEYVSNNDATFDKDGTKIRKCEECGYEETGVDEGSKLSVLIPAGTFQMGSEQGEDYNKPVHEVTITKDFYMGKYEITQAEYEKYCSYGRSGPSSRYGDGDNYPVYWVSSYDALVYCNKRSIAEGLTPCYSIDGSTNPDDWGAVPYSVRDPSCDTWKDVATCNWNANGYRLPTEAEWEYAARAGDNTVDSLTYSGTSDLNELEEYAWYYINSNDATHEVGTKLPNAFGLYDMSGNVWEWCWNWYTVSYDTTTEGGSDPTGTSAGSIRVLRGGSWGNGSGYCAVSCRTRNYPYYRGELIGFRVVRTAK